MSGPDRRYAQPDVYFPAQPYKSRNTVGIIALIVSIAGAVCIVIPPVMLIGWVLVGIAFVLSIVALCLRNRKRGQGIAALIISVVGMILGLVVGFFVALAAMQDSLPNVDMPEF